jgi:S-(hydroxymethyl)mycothiol dehydrogenase
MPVTARGAIARTPGAAASIEEFTIGDPGPDEVLVRILASGVCHTDLGVKSGTYGSDGFPFLLGHEGAGVIEAVGAGVTSHKPGDHVILAWRAPCGECRFCKAGKPNFCCASLNAEKRMHTKDGLLLNQVLGIGTFCSHTLVHARQAIHYDSAQRCMLLMCNLERVQQYLVVAGLVIVSLLEQNWLGQPRSLRLIWMSVNWNGRGNLGQRIP